MPLETKTTHSDLKTRGRSHFFAGEYTEAVKCFKEILSKGSSDPDVFIFMGQTLREQSRYTEAAEYFKEAIALDTKNETALYGLADISRQTGQYSDSLRLSQEILLINKNHGWAQYNLGVLLDMAGQYKEAKNMFRKALKTMPSGSPVYKGLAGALVKMGKTSQGIKVYRKGLRLDRSTTEGISTVGNYLLEQQRLKEAERLIKAFFNKGGERLVWLEKLAQAYQRHGGYDKAIALYHHGLRLEPACITLLKQLADLYYSQTLPGKAAGLYERILVLSPGDIKTMELLAACYKENKLYDSSEQLCEDILKIDSRSKPALGCLAELCYERKDYDRAEAAYKRMSDIDPGDISALNGLASIYKQYNRYEEAKQLYLDFRQIASGSIDSYIGLSGIFLKQHQFDEAIRELKEALKMAPRREELKRELDKAMREKRRYDLACVSSGSYSKHLSRQEALEIIRPRFCALGIVYRCNFRCKMCQIWKQDSNEELTSGQWKDFLLAFKRVADNHCQINFAGGEPFLKEGLTDLIRFANDNGFLTAVCSNGYLIDKKQAQSIGESGLRTIALSLDSLNKERHDFIRGVDGSYVKVMEAIELLHRYAPQTEINLLMIILQENLDDVIPLLTWVQGNKKINLINFLGLIQPRGYEKDAGWYKRPGSKTLWPQDKQQLHDIIDKLIEMKMSGYHKLGNPVSQLVNYKKYYADPNQYIRKHITCNMGYSFLSINEKGNVTFCEEMDSIGNVLERDIYDIWFSETAEKIREEVKKCNKNCHQIINCCYEEECLGEKDYSAG